MFLPFISRFPVWSFARAIVAPSVAAAIAASTDSYATPPTVAAGAVLTTVNGEKVAVLKEIKPVTESYV